MRCPFRSAPTIIHRLFRQSSRLPVPDEPLQTTARIIAPIDLRAYRAELPNGKPVVAHLPGRLAALTADIIPGSEVRVEISPYDLDRARIAALSPVVQRQGPFSEGSG